MGWIPTQFREPTSTTATKLTRTGLSLYCGFKTEEILPLQSEGRGLCFISFRLYEVHHKVLRPSEEKIIESYLCCLI